MSPGQTVVDSSATAIATGTTVSATWTPLDAAIAAASSGTAAPPRRSGTWQHMDDDDTDAADRTERRRQQNRRAQRNHRNRVRAYVSSLEQQVVDTIFHDTEANSSFTATATAATAVAAQADVMSSTATHATAFDSFLLSSAATTGATGNLDMFSTPVDYFGAAAATSTTTPMDRITSTATSPILVGGNYAPPPQQQPSHTQVSQTMSMPDMFAPDGCCCDCGKFASAMLSQAQAHGQPWPASMGMFGGMRDWHGPAMFGHGGHGHGHSHSHSGHGGHGHGSHGDGGGGHCSSCEKPLPPPPPPIVAPPPPAHCTTSQPAVPSVPMFESPSFPHHTSHHGYAAAPYPHLGFSMPGAMQTGGVSSMMNSNSAFQQYALVPVPGVYLHPSRGLGLAHEMAYPMMAPRYG